MFWTIDASDPRGTLCEKCALETSNVGFMVAGMAPAGSMAEVALVFDLLAAVHGKDTPCPVTASEFGRCYNEAACHTPAVIPNEVA